MKNSLFVEQNPRVLKTGVPCIAFFSLFSNCLHVNSFLRVCSKDFQAAEANNEPTLV